MSEKIRVLIVEDNPNDAELVLHELRCAGFEPTWKRVQTEREFLSELKSLPDIILSDYDMPQFNGLQAATLLQKSGFNIPFILVSGTVGEDVAVEAIQKGAADYLLKDRIGRLGPAVKRALREVQEQAEHKRTDEALKLFRNLLDRSNDVFEIVDPETGRFLDVNEKGCADLGYTRAELLAMRVSDIDPNVQQSAWPHMMDELRAKRSKVIESYHRRKDGTTFPVEVSISWVKLDREYSVNVVHDITARKQAELERKQIEAQFIEAQKMEVVGHLAGGVAHDFNNILGVIIGYSDLMTPALAADSLPRKCAEEIRHAADRAVSLTRQLLVFSRKQTVEAVVMDPNEAVKSMDKMLRRLVDENVELDIVLGKQVGRIKADSGQIGQVLMNLVVNARDAMPNGGKLTIESSDVTLTEDYARTHPDVKAGDYVALTVADTGVGMTEEVKAHIFEAFFTTKPKGKGTGLGLATCHTIVKQSDGYIEVISNPGHGTAFKIYFPRVDQPLDVVNRPVQTGELPRGTETLLLVEDEPSVRHLACNVLESLGYNVLRANNGQEGLRAANNLNGGVLSLVITDVIMPQMGGKVMAEWLKATYPDLKVLFTSGYTDDAIAKHGVLEPGVAFLPKPYTPAVLARKVRAILDNVTDTSLLRKHVAPKQSP